MRRSVEHVGADTTSWRKTTPGLNALQQAADLPGVDAGDARSVGTSGVEA